MVLFLNKGTPKESSKYDHAYFRDPHKGTPGGNHPNEPRQSTIISGCQVPPPLLPKQMRWAIALRPDRTKEGGMWTKSNTGQFTDQIRINNKSKKDQ